MKKLVVFIVFLTACSANLVTNSDDPVETTVNKNLTVCELLEAEYIKFSNELFNTSFELNKFIDNISPNNVDSDRDAFFKDMEKNWDYQEINGTTALSNDWQKFKAFAGRTIDLVQCEEPYEYKGKYSNKRLSLKYSLITRINPFINIIKHRRCMTKRNY